MHIPRKSGDRIEVDWAGDKLYIVDRDTGEAIPVYLFVGVLPFSMYAYAEGCLRMDMENWIHVHVNVTGQDKLEITPVEKKPANNEYGFTRGAEYYGRK